MDHATDLIESVPGCQDAVLATDGTIEGIFKAMSHRPGVPSIFKKDEFQGLMSSVAKKDYLAGTLEGLTKLYDGKRQKRQLSKETITINSPVFIIQAGGTKTKLFSMLRPEHVESGFLPRFLFVSAEGNLDQRKPLGPRTDNTKTVQGQLRNELSVLRGVYAEPKPVSIGEQTAMVVPTVVAEPTNACYERYDKLEATLLAAAKDSIDSGLYMPMVQRFATSTLKCAVLLAAARQAPKEDKIIVEDFDLIDALAYTSKWIPHMIELLQNLGRSAFENDVQKVAGYIQEHDGCASGVVMRNYKLSKRELDNILETLEGRGMIDIRRVGKGKFLWMVNE
jgi:hypothetical protein